MPNRKRNKPTESLTDFERRMEERKSEKASIARQIVDAAFVVPGDKVFIGLGTTCQFIAEALMRHLKELHIVTHSVSVVRRYRELISSNEISSRRLKVEITGGVVDPTMAYVQSSDLSGANKVILAPHAIDDLCIGGYDAALELSEIVKQPKEIFIAATLEKFGRSFQNPIRKWGHFSRKKRCVVILPEQSSISYEPNSTINWDAVRSATAKIAAKGIRLLPAVLPVDRNHKR